MQEQPLDNPIGSAAGSWYARLHAADCTEEDRRAFETWRNADPLHERAWGRVQRLMLLVSLPRHPQADAAVPGSIAAVERLRRAREPRWALALAACAACLIGVLAWFIAAQPQPVPAPQFLANTTLAQRRELLADGSTLHLDVGAQVRISFDADARSIDLLAGRVMFDVAHNAARPFSVKAGNSTTVALGTAFQVERRGTRVRVTLARGAVRVSDAASAPRWQVDLAPDTEVQWEDGQDLAPSRRSVNAGLATAWTSGRHNFRDTPLTEVLDELNRYATRKVRLGDAQLAEMTVGGSFIAGDGDAIAATLEAVLPVRAEDGGGDEIVLLPR
jgi:transmembrane sensor